MSIPTEPNIAEERFAKLIAMWHGQTPLYRLPNGVLITVASHQGGRTGWAHEVEAYVEKHWREYIAAARAVLEAR